MKTVNKRRRQGKTNYHTRRALLKSGLPRIVFRKTNKYVVGQYVESREAQDKIILGISSKHLLGVGWPKDAIGSLKSTPASYLTGYLMAKKIKEANLKTPIIDFGMLRTLHKTKVHSFINGLVDGGVDIKHKKETFPDEGRTKGTHLKNKIPFEKIKLNIDKV